MITLKKILSWVIFASLLFLATHSAFAATPVVYFGNAPKDLRIGSEFSVKILVDADVAVNAYSVTLGYPSKNLQVVNFDDGHSLIDVWQNRPTNSGSRVTFAGGGTTPFKGTGGELVSIRFKTLASGPVALNFFTAALYQADGKGTKMTPQAATLNFSVGTEQAPPAQAASTTDSTPPAIKSFRIIPDPFSTAHKLVAFSVNDSGTGIGTALLRVRSGFSWSEWENVGNPTAIAASVWATDFKVTDNAGNSTENVIYDWGLISIYLAGGALGVFLLVVLYRMFRRLGRGRSRRR